MGLASFWFPEPDGGKPHPYYMKGPEEIPHLESKPFFLHFCFYLIDLEGSYVKEAVWFQYEEVESVSSQEFDYFQSVDQA